MKSRSLWMRLKHFDVWCLKLTVYWSINFVQLWSIHKHHAHLLQINNINWSKFQSVTQQYKVNNAISERENRVTCVTMLMRRAGCSGMYWAATVLCWAVLGCTKMYWAVLDSTGLYWAVLGRPGLYWAVLGYTGLFWVVLGCSWLYWAVLGYIGLYWAVLGCSRL